MLVWSSAFCFYPFQWFGDGRVGDANAGSSWSAVVSCGVALGDHVFVRVFSLLSCCIECEVAGQMHLHEFAASVWRPCAGIGHHWATCPSGSVEFHRVWQSLAQVASCPRICLQDARRRLPIWAHRPRCGRLAMSALERCGAAERTGRASVGIDHRLVGMAPSRTATGRCP